MAILSNAGAMSAKATAVSQRLPLLSADVLGAADAVAAMRQDLVTVLRPDLLGRADLLADADDAATAQAAVQLAQIDRSLLTALRPDLVAALGGVVLVPGGAQAGSTGAATTAPISRVSPGELITAEKLNLIIDRLNALGGTGSVTLAGDVTGSASDNRAVALQGRAVSAAAPAEGQVLGFANGAWRPTTPATSTAAPVAMRLVAAGVVVAVSAPGVNQNTYRVTSSFGNLRGGGAGAEFVLQFEGFNGLSSYVVHTSQRQVTAGRGLERPQIVARIDPVPANSSNGAALGLGFKVFGAAPNVPPQSSLQQQPLEGELFIEVYQPPLLFTLLPGFTGSVSLAVAGAQAGAAPAAAVAAGVARSAPAPRKAPAKAAAAKRASRGPAAKPTR